MKDWQIVFQFSASQDHSCYSFVLCSVTIPSIVCVCVGGGGCLLARSEDCVQMVVSVGLSAVLMDVAAEVVEVEMSTSPLVMSTKFHVKTDTRCQ